MDCCHNNHDNREHHSGGEHKPQVVLYSCPMHPGIRQERPGMCPECGMGLVATKHEAHNTKHDGGAGRQSFDKSVWQAQDRHAGHSTNAFRNKFWISLILSVPVVLYSDIVATLTGWMPPAFPGSRYLPALLASVIFFYGGWIFIASAWRELRAKLPGMMTLIAIAIAAAYVYSVYVVFIGPSTGLRAGEGTLFWELATLITVMLLGHWLEMKAVSGAQSALKELSKLLPDKVDVLRGGKEEQIPLSELKIGDMFLVRPGGKIAADGIVTEGRSDVNESLITGESKPVLKEKESKTIAGSINGDGSLKIKVEQIGEHTFLAGVMRLVSEAQASKSRLQVLSDRAAFYLTVIAVLVGAFTFVWWFAGAKAGLPFAIERLVAVLVIACPHALGLAVPLVASISTTKAARGGFLVKQRLALEAARNIGTILFDKTGTLTRGEYGVQMVVPAGEFKESEILGMAASVDSHSEHFVAKAIVGEARKRELGIVEVQNFKRLPGRGVKGEIDGTEIYAGGEAILPEASASVPEELRVKAKRLAQDGQTIVYVTKDRKLAGFIALGDLIREESREAIREIKSMGMKTAMLTGDSEEVASWVAKELGIDEYFARVLPNEKAEKVKLLQSRSEKVAMVGDGINDAPALTQADLGIAIGAGTNVAIESAGIILVRNDPRDIVKIVKLSRMTYSKMIQNLFWATGYNVVAIPLAAGVLAAQGILLQPALAALFMSLSTVIVAVNAVLLKRKKL